VTDPRGAAERPDRDDALTPGLPPPMAQPVGHRESLPPPTVDTAPTVETAGGAVEAVEAVDDGWHRVHPLTPVLRSWQVLIVAVFFLGQDVSEGLVRGDGLGDGIASDVADNGVAGALVALGLLALFTAFAYVSWRKTRYRVLADALEFERGVLSRQQRRAPLDRLQAVDITEPLVARILGLARLTLEVAGGGNSRIEITYLTEADARRLRNHLLAAAAGLRSDSEAPPQVGDAPEAQVLQMPTDRLIGSILLSGSSLFLLVVAIVTVVVVTTSGEFGFLALLLPAALGTGGLMWSRLTTWFAFRVASAPDGVRLRHGMFEQRTQTVPPGRVQALRLHQPLLWRLKGWWVIEVNIAGYTSVNTNDGTATKNVLLPVGTIDDALQVLWFVVPGLELDEGAITGVGDHAGFTPAPRRARWADPIAWRRHGFRVDGPALVIRRGRLHRRLDVVPHARTQSVGVEQGPLQRRLGLASFALHSTPGPIHPRVDHLASDVAAQLLEEQATRARAARVTARDAWLTNPPPPRCEP
jgi:putative membrane protein